MQCIKSAYLRIPCWPNDPWIYYIYGMPVNAYFAGHAVRVGQKMVRL